MSMDRRDFLRIIGLSTVAGGIGGAGLLELRKGTAEAGSAAHGRKKGSGTTLAMVIDVRKLESPDQYKRCIDACHKAHNVPDFGNPKDEIKWIWPDDFEHSFPGAGHEYVAEEVEKKQFLLLCNQCEKPACVRVCPTQATFKRASDGIVMMDYHRCIGCRFCMAACPFGARSFNWRDPRGAANLQNPANLNPKFPTRMKGVVEKCNFCAERLREGLEPACVEACKDTKAIVFGNLDDPKSEVREMLRTHYTIQRKPELGTNPRVFYVIGG